MDSVTRLLRTTNDYAAGFGSYAALQTYCRKGGRWQPEPAPLSDYLAH